MLIIPLDLSNSPMKNVIVTPKIIALYRRMSLISLTRYFQLPQIQILQLQIPQLQIPQLQIPQFQILRNETFSKRFIKKFHKVSNNSYEIKIKWITKKKKPFFKLKIRNPHPACVIYEGLCVCEQTYIGKTRRNVELRREEHENTSKDSEPAKHLKGNLSHKFS